jgi:uncharacterized membrane protein
MKLPSEISMGRSRAPLLALTLFASVLLNLFLAGALVGGCQGVVHHKSIGPMILTAPHSEYMIEWMTRYLDAHDADAFRAAFDAEAEDLKQAHDQVRQATNDVATLFTQTTPDPGALQAAMTRLRDGKARIQVSVEKILQSAYGKLSPAGRRRLADLTQNPI